MLERGCARRAGAGARSGPRAARARGRGYTAREGSDVRGAMHTPARARPPRQLGYMGCAPRHFPHAHAGQQAARPRTSLCPSTHGACRCITECAGDAARAQGTRGCPRGSQSPPRAGWAGAARVRQGGSGAASGALGARARPRREGAGGQGEAAEGGRGGPGRRRGGRARGAAAAAPRTDEQVAAGGELACVRARVHVLHDLGRAGGQQVVGADVAPLRGREAAAGAAGSAQLPARPAADQPQQVGDRRAALAAAARAQLRGARAGLSSLAVRPGCATLSTAGVALMRAPAARYTDCGQGWGVCHSPELTQAMMVDGVAPLHARAPAARLASRL
jgi:hypothetical protein